MHHFTAYVFIFLVLMLPGIFAEILTLSGLPYMFVVAFAFGYLDKFQHLGNWDLIILGIIALAGLIVNNFFGFFGAKYFGASKKALIAGAIGFLIGLIILPPLGGFAGLFLGVLIIELINLPDVIKAFRKATGSLLGSLAGILVNLVLAAAFIFLFVFFVTK